MGKTDLASLEQVLFSWVSHLIEEVAGFKVGHLKGPELSSVVEAALCLGACGLDDEGGQIQEEVTSLHPWLLLMNVRGWGLPGTSRPEKAS